MTARWQLVLLGILATIMHFTRVSYSGINECEVFQKCLFLNNGTNSTNSTSTNLTSTSSSKNNQTVSHLYNGWHMHGKPERRLVDNKIDDVAVCFDLYFCTCTDNNAICALQFYTFDLFVTVITVAFYITLAVFICTNFVQRRRVIIEETNFRFWKRKMIMLFLGYIAFVIFNLFLPSLINRFIYHRHGFYFGGWSNLPWMIVAFISPLYLLVWTVHNEQFIRVIRINRLVTRLDPVQIVDVPEDDCSICLDNLSAMEVVKTPCNHYFHLSCIREVIITTNICPLCRATIITVLPNGPNSSNEPYAAQPLIEV